MNGADKNSIIEQSVCFADTVQAMINRSCIIDFGIIKEVVANGVVVVAISVANGAKDIKIITCVLANIASTNFTLNIIPKEGDKVLIVYPRRFSNDMFDTTKQDIIIEKFSSGYNLLSGIAIPISQYKIDGYKNVLEIEEGIIKYTSEDNWVELNLTESGTIALADSNGNSIETTSSSMKLNGKLEIKV